MGSTLRLILSGQRNQADLLHRKSNGGRTIAFHYSSHRVRKQWAAISRNIFCLDLANCLSIQLTKDRSRSSLPNSIGLSTVKEKGSGRSSVQSRFVTSSVY